MLHGLGRKAYGDWNVYGNWEEDHEVKNSLMCMEPRIGQETFVWCSDYHEDNTYGKYVETISSQNIDDDGKHAYVLKMYHK